MTAVYTKAALVKAKIAPTWTDGSTVSLIGSDSTVLARITPESEEQEVTGILQFVQIEGSKDERLNGRFVFSQTLMDGSGNLLPVSAVDIMRPLKDYNSIVFSGENPPVNVSSSLIRLQQAQKPRWDMTSGDKWEREIIFAGHLLHASLVSRGTGYSSLLSSDDILDRAKKSAKQLSKETADGLQQQLDNGNNQISADAQANGKQVEDIQGQPSDQWEKLVNDESENLKLTLISDADNMRQNTISYIRGLKPEERDHAANVAVAGFRFINEGSQVIFDNVFTVAQGIIGKVIDAWKEASAFIDNVVSIASDVAGLIGSLF